MTKKRLRTTDEVDKYFSVDLFAFIYSTHTNKSQNLLTRIKEKNVLSWKEKETWNKATAYE
jgi:hypothetical protein